MEKAIMPQKESGVVKDMLFEVGSSRITNQIKQLISLLKALLTTRKTRGFVKIPTITGFVMFRIQDIVRIETHSSYARTKGIAVKNGDGNSTHIFTKWDGHYRIARQICEWKKMLKNDGSFMQTHQSHLVNSFHIRRVYDEDGMVVELMNGDTVPVSRNYKDDVINRLRERPFGFLENWNEDDGFLDTGT